MLAVGFQVHKLWGRVDLVWALSFRCGELFCRWVLCENFKTEILLQQLEFIFLIVN